MDYLDQEPEKELIYIEEAKDDDKIRKVNELEEIRDKMEKDIKYLWENVMVLYLQNLNKRQVLDLINETDYHKFYKFMINNNKAYNEIQEQLNNLN